MRNLTLLTLSLFLFSCGEQSSVKSDLASLMSRPISLPKEVQITFLGRDTTITDIFDSEVKMVVYADSLDCTSCSTNKMYLWEPFTEYAEAYYGKLKYYLIHAPSKKSLNSIRNSFRSSMLKYPIIVDSLGEFERLKSSPTKEQSDAHVSA